MKVTYMEAIENHMAWRAKNYCPACGAHEYDIVEQLEPEVENRWFIRCPQCGVESLMSPSREIALARWQQC